MFLNKGTLILYAQTNQTYFCIKSSKKLFLNAIFLYYLFMNRAINFSCLPVFSVFEVIAEGYYYIERYISDIVRRSLL